MNILLGTITADDIIFIALLAVIGFTGALALTPLYTALAFRLRWWKRPRVDAITGEKAAEFGKLHNAKHKKNIPTMAGMIFILVTALVTITVNLSRSQTLLPLVATLGAAAVGLIDDIINLRNGHGVAGLRTKVKLGLIFLVALLGGLYFHYKLGYTTVALPFFDGELSIGGLGVIALFVLAVVSTANAVNFTDGLDGLAGGLLSSAFGAYAFIALLQGHIGIAGFCATIVGALQAYTWFNVYPARFFMGDIGSFALGTALGVVAMLTDTIVLLPIIGGVFVLEAGSSVIQILSKKLFKRKVFRVAPLHHHFEAIGWPETKVTMRFWILGQVAAVVGVVAGLLGGLL